MKMFISLLFFCLTLCTATEAFAYKCAIPSLLECFDRADQVFQGKVSSIQHIEPLSLHPTREITISVTRHWKGSADKEVILSGPLSVKDFNFVNGQEYIVFLDRDSSGIPELCSGTRLVDKGTDAFVVELEQVAKFRK